MRSRSVALWFLLVSLTFAGLSCSRDPNVRNRNTWRVASATWKPRNIGRPAIQFSNSIQADPKFAEAYYQLSRAEIQQGDVRAAAYALNKTISLDPNHLRAHVDLGALLLAAGQKDLAEQHLATAIQLNSNDVEAHDIMARLRASQEIWMRLGRRLPRLFNSIPTGRKAI